MSLLSWLFGASESAEPLNFETQKDWYVSDSDLNHFADALTKHPNLRLTRSRDSMDDDDILSLSLIAYHIECKDLDVPPAMVFRARKKGTPVVIDQFVLFKDTFFARRGQAPTVRLRFGNSEPATLDTSISTDKSSLFFEGLDILQKTLFTDKLLLQITTERGSPVLATFDFVAARPALDIFSLAALGPDFREIFTVNHQIINTILRMGPKSTLTNKKAFAAVAFPPGPIDYTKNAAFYKAVQAYAVARRASEVYGAFPDMTKSSKPNMPWEYSLYNEVPRRIRDEMGRLKIFD